MNIFRILTVWLVAVSLLLTGCGGGGGSADSSDGEVVIGLTDAEGDFMAYAVDVTSIKLTHRNGSVVEVLPQSSRIDFSQYVDMTEFVTAATIPNGHYEHVALTLDYSDADVQVEVNGVPVQAAVQDENGNALSVVEMSVKLDSQHPLVIAPGVPAHLTLDFDLEVSNQVNTAVTPPVVTVSPMLVADVELDNAKQHRLRGLLKGVDEKAQAIELAIRPLHRRDGHFGEFKAFVNEDTHYEIDGVNYVGDAGFEQMLQQQLRSWVIVHGVLNYQERRFTATEVYAGESVAANDKDAVIGVVTARAGDLLTVDARMVVTADGQQRFNQTVQVQLTESTKVTKQLDRAMFDTQDVSVGQRVHVLGEFMNTIGGTGELAAQHVRMKLTPVNGEALSVNDGELVIGLQHIAGRPQAMFDLAGTGVSAEFDADAANYQVDTSTLSLEGIDLYDPVHVSGFVNTFGMAPADFNATSVVDVSGVRGQMLVTWEDAKLAPFVSASLLGWVIDLNGSQRHHVRRHHVTTDLTLLAQLPTLKPVARGEGLYAIHHDGAVSVYTLFGDFDQALSDLLDGTRGVKQIAAGGHFDNAAATMVSNRIRVVLE